MAEIKPEDKKEEQVRCWNCGYLIKVTKTWAGMDYYYRDSWGKAYCPDGRRHSPNPHFVRFTA